MKATLENIESLEQELSFFSILTENHINARNFTLEQWKRLYINYARLESIIDGWQIADEQTMPSTAKDSAK